ncbi:MAG: neutral/alkaline non-lysosomal ceramidase N-terminal domain-containing protein [Tannerella sp.]|jgi:exo-1,4-beta-D-glucosaminidase|nr:neutral/alkaline non-lysosomal ceramidase N-terminal domain-containing protein [Tannerella sp.]
MKTVKITGMTLLILVLTLFVCSYNNMRDRRRGYTVDLTVQAGEPQTLRAGFAAVGITPEYMEPWNDVDGNARYEPKKGDTYEDTNGNGRFDTYRIAGFGNKAAAQGVHDDLWARTMVLDDGRTRLALTVVDVIGLFHPLVIDIRKMLPEEAGITYLVIASTHTHEGPDLMGFWGSSPLKSGVNKAWKEVVKQGIVQSVVEAVAALRPACLHFSQNPSEGMATLADTREPYVYDEGLRILRVTDAETSHTLGTLIQWANHPETLWSRNLLLSSDFPHYLREAVEKGVYKGDTLAMEGAGGVAIYVNGAVGGLMTTHATTGVKDPFRDTVYVEPSFDKIRAQGDTLGLIVLRAMREKSVEVRKAGINLRARTFELPVQNKLFLLAAAIGVMDADMSGWMKKRTEAAVWSIGPATFLTFPGELYPEILNGGIEALPGRDFNVEPQETPPLRELMPGEFRFGIGLANDEIGYIIPKSQWDRKAPYVYRDKPYYGEENSLGPETAPLLYKELCSLLNELPKSSDVRQHNIEEIILTDNWNIRSSEGLTADGAALSVSPVTDRWIKTSLPCTVLGALCNAGVYKDPFFGMNLEKIPVAQFEKNWWYHTSFDLSGFDDRKEQAHLLLDGVNYRANVWLNGTLILSSDTTFGAFRQFTCDITNHALKTDNRLAVEIIPPQAGDFYMGFVDWAPVPPDHNMGIYRQVRIRRSGKASIAHPFIMTDVNTETLREATLSISAELTNHYKERKNLTLEAKIENCVIRKTFALEEGQTILARLTPEEFDRLHIENPRLWWPNGLGNPEMYTLHLSLREGNTLCDTTTVRFGIRAIDTYKNEQGARGYRVNGRNVLIKSAGWVDDLFLRDNSRRNRAQIRYVKEMNLNSLRFEGFWGTSQEIYDLCDENGIMLMPGWSCQWEWPDYLGLAMEVPEEDQNIPINEGVDKYGVRITPAEERLLSDMFRDQARWLRNHPSIFVWAVGSDAMPKPSLEKKYTETLNQLDPGRSLLVSAGEFTSELSGPTGMKMNGPYEYVPPIYWYEDRKLGGAFGFNTETGPGPQIPPISSIRKMIPEKDLWPPLNPVWDYHSGRKDFSSVKIYLDALNKRYGTPQSLEELAMKAQWANYEAIRPMFEAFVVNRPIATGVVQWQLNSAWPEFYWQLYDWYLMPTGAYFGTQKACRPLNIIYNYYDKKVYVANDLRGDITGHTARAALYDRRSTVLFEHEKKLSVKENASVALTELPTLPGKEDTYFLHLTLHDANRNLVADNFYWLSGQEDRMDWSAYYWFYTPQKQFANFQALNRLPQARIDATKKAYRENDEWVIEITLSNTAKNIAFCMELLLVDSVTEEPILPVYWSDNYVSPVGGETKTISARCSLSDASSEPSVIIQGVNTGRIKK